MSYNEKQLYIFLFRMFYGSKFYTIYRYILNFYVNFSCSKCNFTCNQYTRDILKISNQSSHERKTNPVV